MDDKGGQKFEGKLKMEMDEDVVVCIQSVEVKKNDGKVEKESFFFSVQCVVVKNEVVKDEEGK